jgi:hypothetical protein
MILRYFDFTTSMLVIMLSIMLICGITLLLGWRSIRAIPIENLRKRLVCVVEYTGIMALCLLIANIIFQRFPFLDEPNDFDTPQRLFKTYYMQIENIKIAHFALYHTLLWASASFLNLMRIALKSEN